MIIILSIFLGKYIFKIFKGETVWLSRVIEPFEKRLYRFLKIEEKSEMSAKKYFTAIVIFSLVSFIVLFAILLLQNFLPFNPQNRQGVNFSLAFNTAVSFITNTNWQNYKGEDTISYFTQMLGLTVQNFLSAGVGIAVLFCFIRGIINTKMNHKTVGNFWRDLIRIQLYLLIPLSILVSFLLIAGGVIQTLKPAEKIQTLEDGTEQILPLGPVASQVAIKQLGTNGGGFFGSNSAHPFENPNSFTNAIEMISIILIPASLVITFGLAVKDTRQGKAIFTTMALLFIVALATVSVIEYQNVNMEGKEVRFGTIDSSFWAVSTTAAANGSVNSMHDSYEPLSGAILMTLMGIGEIIFGGVGSGLYTMIGFIMIAVFIAGLMIGRTPEYLGKKIEPHDIKMAMVVVLTTFLGTLVGISVLTILPKIGEHLTNQGAQGFSEMIYAVISTSANNGSSFAGFQGNGLILNYILAALMLIGRFIPIYAVIQLSESFSSKKKVALSEGTLETHNRLFIGFSLGVILIMGALSIFPLLSLGPIAEFFK